MHVYPMVLTAVEGEAASQGRGFGRAGGGKPGLFFPFKEVWRPFQDFPGKPNYLLFSFYTPKRLF